MITELKFIEATGRKPEDDDMARVNCKYAGMGGHTNCGWNYTRSLPAFMCTTTKKDRVPT